MALTLAEALAINPPSVASRCTRKSSDEDPACQPCSTTFFECSPCLSNTQGSCVQFQLTYTRDRSTYAPCYRPIIPKCYPCPMPIRKTTCCCLKWHDCCGNPVFKGVEYCIRRKMSCRSSCRKAWRRSTLPPPCCHIKPAPFCCPKDGCPPMQQQQCPPKRCSTPTICPPLICRDRPCPPPAPPTICIAGPCSLRPCRIKSECPPLPMKILPPPSCTRFCISYTCDGSTYAPCYYSNLPKCPRVDYC